MGEIGENFIDFAHKYLLANRNIHFSSKQQYLVRKAFNASLTIFYSITLTQSSHYLNRFSHHFAFSID